MGVFNSITVGMLQKAALFEKEVKKGNLELHENFIDTLNKINVYLYD